MPDALRHLVCSVCGLSNTDSSWQLADGQWVHTCPVAEHSFEDDPTPVTDPIRERWSPKRRDGICGNHAKPSARTDAQIP